MSLATGGHIGSQHRAEQASKKEEKGPGNRRNGYISMTFFNIAKERTYSNLGYKES